MIAARTLRLAALALVVAAPASALGKKPPAERYPTPAAPTVGTPGPAGAPQRSITNPNAMTPTMQGQIPAPPPVRPPPPPPPVFRPNQFEVKSGTLSVTYSSSGVDGKPHLAYKDAGTDVQFSGDQIRTAQSDLGELVTVTIRRTVDAGSTSFTLIVPSVLMDQASDVVSVNLVGVTTVHRFSPVPRFNRGQLDSGNPTVLNGTARQVKF